MLSDDFPGIQKKKSIINLLFYKSINEQIERSLNTWSINDIVFIDNDNSDDVIYKVHN